MAAATSSDSNSAVNAKQNVEKHGWGLKQIAPKVLAPVVMLAISLGFPTASPAALTTEQKVAASVWQVVDQGFVDEKPSTFSSLLIKNQYVFNLLMKN